jgi:hypothetical protein
MAKPKPIYDAALTYRTPSGRRVRYGRLVAAETLSECEDLLRGRLSNDVRFGRRRVADIVGEFSASFVTMQIATR